VSEIVVGDRAFVQQLALLKFVTPVSVLAMAA